MRKSLLFTGQRGKYLVVISFAICALLLLSYHLSMAAEAGYPSRSIELIIGYAPGAGTDLGTRMIAEKAKQYLGQEIVCVNKPGGAGRLAYTLIAKAKPDGYNLAASTDGGVNLGPHLEQVPYKPLEDFTFISQFGVLDFGVTVRDDSPFKTFKQMIDYARANPDKLTISTVGVGTADAVALEAVMVLAKVKYRLVPFNGAAQAMTALLGNHVMAASTGTSGYAPYLKAKNVRLLVSMSEKRRDDAPDAPTLKELGYPLVINNRYIIVGPKGMDQAIVKKLSDAFKKAMEAPEFIKLAKDLETYSEKTLHGEELRAVEVVSHKAWGDLFKSLGLTGTAGSK
jgi:tripartite-type tricarboxylate transporter receptor subunit TctC